MTIESEAAAGALLGGVAQNSVDRPARSASPACSHREPRAACLNCGAAQLGAYCVECGQPAHIHRSFVSLGHDVLHSVFHFEGKFWRTMPELIFHPGRLTKRYIEGERAKFISPMALFLFTVFLMYAVFAFLPDEQSREAMITTVTDQQSASRAASDAEEEAAAPSDPRQTAGPSAEGAQTPANDGAASASDDVFSRAFEKFREDPALVGYKMKSNGYKFSWLLVPLSIPFMWLLFFWRREFSLYDHAVFVTYSISFMTLLLIAGALIDAVGAGGAVPFALTMLVPPLHIYKQLRGAYGLSRRGALVRLVFVLFAAWTVMVIFMTMLFLIGALD